VLWNSVQLWFQSLKSSNLNLLILGLLANWKLLNVICVTGLVLRTQEIWTTCARPLIITMLTSQQTCSSFLILSSSINPRKLWKVVNTLFSSLFLPVLPSYDSRRLLSKSFATFFSDKIHKLQTPPLINRTSASAHLLHLLLIFTCVATDEVSKLPSQSPDTNCDLDPRPTPIFLKQCSHILLHKITSLINLSISDGIWPGKLKSDSFTSSPQTNLALMNMILVIIVLYLISHFYQNLLKR